MISYTLKCEHGHQFDSWFQSAEAFDKLLAADMITCSVCGALGVEKAVMAPRVRTGRDAAPRPVTPTSEKSVGPLSAPASPAEQALAELRKMVEKNSENVGEDFATEARRIHEGEAPERSIYGQAKPDEAKALIEEGIPVAPLPWGNRKTN
ncbi:DUF1178 family protein [Neptunicoccus cionae]|uniref:DUF1178 domain-containing protein n=1 Tax=Neptunicoccus cionae TaxID=2035344 RepID=A0A916QS81_9RHOB|nr:DUF1178 family protein [Amylibacter cionae]GGA07934.1 hypothetical protein GCM10011498_04680 [Amylibacter cionae]